MNTENSNELRQLLLELHYGLLPDDEAERLQDRITSDAATAAVWAETLQTVEKLGAACRTDETVELTASLKQPAMTENDPLVVPPEIRRPVWRTPTSLAVVAACLGWIVIAVNYRDKLPAPPQPAIELRASLVASKDFGTGTGTDARRTFRVTTTRLDRVESNADAKQNRAKRNGASELPAISASLSYRVLAGNTILFSDVGRTNRDGQAEIVLPPQLTVPPDARLQIDARASMGENDSTTEPKAVRTRLDVPLEPTRCMTYLTIDRPVYRPGETVFFRSLTLTRRSFAPSVEVPIRYELIDPSGTAVPGAFLEGLTTRGVGNGRFGIPTTAPGGSYTIVAKSLDGFFPDERRELEVRDYRVPRFKKKLDLDARSYGPGETVTAMLNAERAEGGPVAGGEVRITATVDRETVYEHRTVTSSRGDCSITFALPEIIRDGDAVLSVVIDDGGTRESISKTIPIALGRIDVEFYPEGGELVGGLPNRVYFVARNTLGDPVDVEGEIQDRNGRRVASVKTVRDGMGRFELQPETGQQYSLKITAPIDIQNTPELPRVVSGLPVLDTGDGVFDSQRPLKMMLHSGDELDLIVRAVCRGELVGSRRSKLSRGRRLISIPLADDVDGVVRITVLDASTLPATPLLERLVFRRPAKQLRIEVLGDESQRQRSPGESVRLNFQVRDENGQPAPAVLGVAVVDDAALSLDGVERPTMSTHFWLTSEVKSPEDLEHANFYLSDAPDAEQAIDLLLGTQGWRRFASGPTNTNRNTNRDGISSGDGQPNEAFREQLTRLLQLDGVDQFEPSQRHATTPGYLAGWRDYQIGRLAAWREFVTGIRVWLFFVWLFWLFVILVRLRLQRTRREPFSGRLANWLLLAGLTVPMGIYGCGAADNRIVEMDAASTALSADPAPGTNNRQPRDENVASGDTPATVPQRVIAVVSRFTEGVFRGQGKNGLTDAELLAPITKEQLERLLTARGINAEQLADRIIDELRFPVRQYAHRHGKDDSQRRDDFTETLFWQPLLITDSDGKASVRFDLSDSVTTFRVLIDGHTAGGRIGSSTSAVTSRLPFQIEPKLPLEVTTGDRIDLPVAVINATDDRQDITMSAQTDPALRITGDASRTLTLDGQERQREIVSFDVIGETSQDAFIEMDGRANDHTDRIRRTLRVVPSGYPVHESFAGKMSGRASVSLPLDENLVPGSLEVSVRAFPSPMADVMTGIDSILTEPHGCFEQASATNYPNAMVLLYLENNEIAAPTVSRRANQMLDRGYQKIIAYECDRLGYEWFGDDPGHEALSAFGLMQFTDMARVMHVNAQMISRTRDWLLTRRDGQGGFLRNPRHLHVWSVDQEIVNAYVLWAVSEADVSAGTPDRTQRELGAELDRLQSIALESDDAYLIALSAATLLNVGRVDAGERLLESLTLLQGRDGGLQGRTTVTSSGGLSRAMETTSLAAIAWMKSSGFRIQAQSAGRWIASHRSRGGGFGSTQGTVLALKALLALSGSPALPDDAEIRIELGGRVIGRADLTGSARDGSTAIEITGLGPAIEQALEQSLESNENLTLELIAEGAERLSYAVDVVSHQTQPADSLTCPLKLTTTWQTDDVDTGNGDSGNTDTGNAESQKRTALEIEDGQTTQVNVKLENPSATGFPMTVAIVGLPGGVEPRGDRLDELMKAGEFDYYERNTREVVFYWRNVSPQSVRQFHFDVTATIPGRYTGPASRTYLYYTSEEKVWATPLEIEIQP